MNRTDTTPKPKRRWAMILASLLVAFVLLGGAIALLNSLKPEASRPAPQGHGRSS
ncbi:MAG TPA: hypothetical protein VL101_10550 [Nordella sp.]|nr:hypothetical protein [Nordella sp.]